MKEFAQGLLAEVKTIFSTRLAYVFVGVMLTNGTSLKSVLDQLQQLGGF